MWLFSLRCAILCILHTPVSLVHAYCWEPGRNPYFTGPPIVQQVDLQTVRVSWLGLVENRECTDQFVVKYWQKINPQDYQLTKLVEQQVNSIDIKIIPKVDYQFQAVAREDKGSVLGVDWNKSNITDFRTSIYNREVTDEPPNSNDINQLDAELAEDFELISEDAQFDMVNNSSDLFDEYNFSENATESQTEYANDEFESNSTNIFDGYNLFENASRTETPVPETLTTTTTTETNRYPTATGTNRYPTTTGTIRYPTTTETTRYPTTARPNRYPTTTGTIRYPTTNTTTTTFTTTTMTMTTADEFDDFFDATEAPTLEEKITNFGSTIQVAHVLATELKTKLTETSDDKEAKDLGIQLHEVTQTLSSLMESNQLLMLVQQASRILANVRNCRDLANLGMNESGTYQINPKGPHSIAEPIMAFCDFTTNSTEITHDQMSEIMIEKCPNGEFGCHQSHLNFVAPMDQIRALIAASETCEQAIRFDCFIAPLFSYGSDHMGFWRDWNGTKRTFFHGTLDANQTHMCQCGVNQTCIEPNLSCNCDAKLPDWQVDEGIITDKNLLPVTEFAYGPLEYDLEEAKVSIGSLKCSGSTIGSTSHYFAPTQPVLPPPEILRNDCGLAELMTDNRLKINLRYSNNMNCFITLKLPETKTMKLTIDDFSSEGDYDYFYVYDGTYESRTRLKTYDGRKGDISYQWSGDAATFYWKTDGSSSGSSMTAYVDF